MSDIFLLFILTFQSISCRNIMLSSCSPAQIYILLLCRRPCTLPKMLNMKYCSTYAYNWVNFWFLQFPEQFPYPALHIYFQHYAWHLYYFQSVFISHWVHLFDIICHQMPYVLIFCTNQLKYSIVVHIPWHIICHLHLWYIWNIYLCMNCNWLIHFTTCYYCHSQNNATVHNWYMSWNKCM